MTTFSWAGRLLPAVLARAAARLDLPVPRRAVDSSDLPSAWERGAFDDTIDDDPFGWLGFATHGQDDEPLLPWPRPARWPDLRVRAA